LHAIYRDIDAPKSLLCRSIPLRMHDWTNRAVGCLDETQEELVARGAFEEGPSLHVTSSIIASGVASVTSNPVDLLKTRLMNMRIDPSSGKLPYTGMLDCAVQTVRNEGVLALWKGLGPTLARQAPLNVVRFMCVEQFKKLFDSMKSPEPLAAPAVAPTKGMFSH